METPYKVNGFLIERGLDPEFYFVRDRRKMTIEQRLNGEPAPIVFMHKDRERAERWCDDQSWSEEAEDEWW